MPAWFLSPAFEWAMVFLVSALGYCLWAIFGPSLATSSPAVEFAYSLAAGDGFKSPYAFHSPPLYPLLLAGFLKLSNERHIDPWIPDTVAPFRVLNLGFYLFSVFLVYFFVRRTLPAPWTWVITGLYALSPLTVLASSQPTADMAFVVFVLLSLLTIDQMFADKDTPVTAAGRFWSCFWMGAAMLTRNLGWVLPLAYLFLAFRRKEFKIGLINVTVLVLCLMPWTLTEVYYRNAEPLRVAEASAAPSERFPRAMLKEAARNVEKAVKDAAEGTLGTFNLRRFNGTLFRKAYVNQVEISLSELPWFRWVLGGILALGGFIALSAWSGIASLYMGAFLLVTVLLPVEQKNLMLPVMPVILYTLFVGLMQLGLWLERLNVPATGLLMSVMAGLIGLNSISGHLDRLHEVRLIRTAQLAPSPRLQALDWLKQNTPENAEIMTPHRKLELLEGRRSVRFPKTSQPEKLAKRLMQADYIVEDDSEVQTRFRQVRVQHPNAFKNVYEDNDLRIWQVVR
jgi:hypothetical protein